MMKATSWEFNNRALIFGLVFAVSFPLYAVDHQNSTQALAVWLGPHIGVDADLLTRSGFAVAAVLLMFAALLRTWASSYLHSDVVYATEVKSESLVADGPYRRVRNPLYLANILMVIAMGSLMSGLGFVVGVVGMWLFCYRLILREEGELLASQGERYRAYCERVPRLWPSLTARLPESGQNPRWTDGFKAESWYWGFAASLVAFAITLKLKLFFIILAVSLALFWLVSSLLQKSAKAQSAAR
jgi:protein-S-isoprenylcysteine O-methyltransferase Ste14